MLVTYVSTFSRHQRIVLMLYEEPIPYDTRVTHTVSHLSAFRPKNAHRGNHVSYEEPYVRKDMEGRSINSR